MDLKAYDPKRTAASIQKYFVSSHLDHAGDCCARCSHDDKPTVNVRDSCASMSFGWDYVEFSGCVDKELFESWLEHVLWGNVYSGSKVILLCSQRFHKGYLLCFLLHKSVYFNDSIG